MLRFVAANGDDALSDLIASVTAKPPYGQVPVPEAKAIRNVIEGHQYEVVIPDRVYQSALKLIQNSSEKSSALEVFRLHDRIANSPADSSAADAAEGLALAEHLGHDGLRARFRAIQAETAYKAGNVADEARVSANAFDLFRTLAADDATYQSNWRKTGTNTAAFFLMEGDFETARRICDEMEEKIGTAVAPALGEDDLDCIALFVLNDKQRASSGVAITSWQLIAAIAVNVACKARSYSLLGMFTASHDAESALGYYRLGEQALDGTDLKLERAHLLNESAALLAGPLRRFEESLPLSELAARLAEDSGDKKIAADSLGNSALALLNLNRAE